MTIPRPDPRVLAAIELCTWRPDGRRACWRYLGQTWETLARQFLSQCEDHGQAEEDGTVIYERIMEVTGWV